MRSIGIDPGLSGAIAFIDEYGAHVEDMPVAAGDVDEAGLAHLLMSKKEHNFHVYIERVHSMPKQGGASIFKFGTGYGAVRGVVAASGMPFTLVTPNKWKKFFMLDSDKEKSRQRALQLFPELAKDLARKKDSGRAEALLIAHYGKMMSNGGNQ